MRIQRVQINNKISHVFDYDTNGDQIEKFIINAPTSDNISILKFHKDSDGSFIVDSDKGKEKYSFKSATLSKLEGQKVPSYFISIEFEPFVKREVVTQTNDGTIFNKSKQTQPEANIETTPLLSIIEHEAAISWSDVNEKSCIDFAVRTLPENPIMLRIEFRLPYRGTFGDEVKSKMIELYVAPKELIYDVILDFGSEATQMACYSRGATATIAGFVPLFSNIRQRYQDDSEKTILDEDFYQNDISDDRFYRSYFILKDQVSNEELGQILDNINHDGGREFFKTLTSKKFVEGNKSKYIVAPNVKISCFGGQEMPRIKVNNKHTSINLLGDKDSHLLYRLGILPFLYEAINEVVNDTNARFISFHILMPNVYLQVEISKILQLLQDDIKKLLNTNEKFDVIWGFDVTAVSESDASIIGACELMRSQNVDDQLPMGKYLLLDAGKGTLDLSLIEYKFDQIECSYSYNNLWRSGIIGAGNSLSYAFMFELVHKYLESNAKLNGGVKESDIVSFIKGNILNVTTDGSSINADPYYLLQLMRLVDSFKIYHKNVLDINEDDNNDKLLLKDLKLSGFTDWLAEHIDEASKGVKLNVESGRYIQRMIRSIVNEVMNSLNDMSVLFADNNGESCVDYIIFSGRAFKLAEFKSEMYRALQTRYANIQEKTFIRANLASSMKNICLLCSRPLVNGNYSRKINSSVKLIDKKPQKVNTASNKSTERSGLFNGSRIVRGFRNFLFGGSERSNSDSGEIDFDSNNEDIAPRLNISIGGRLFNSSELFGRDADPNAITGNSDERQGYGLKIENPESALINIGGVRFPFSNANIQLGADRKVDILFNGEYHILRSARDTKELKRQDINMTVSPFMISSFFPNCTVNGEVDFTIPQIKPLWQEVQQSQNEDSASKNNNEPNGDREMAAAASGQNEDRSRDEGTELDNLLNN
ncbi:MAG: hypothetical protein J6K74_04285 [Marinifilaceae bacterium]|nr:hypothetical protein [Marinifilaceae bacterium]